MKRWLICAGLEGQPTALGWLARIVAQRQPDALFFAGGVLGPDRSYRARASTQWGLSSADALFVEQFFHLLGEFPCFSAVIPGLYDTPLEEFLRLGMHAELEQARLHLVHATLIEERGVAVCGMGGRLVEKAVPEPDQFSRAMVEYYLRPLQSSYQPRKVLLLPEPPCNGLGGRLGSRLISQLVDSLHPTVCIVGGESSRRGLERVASTWLINPGRLREGWAAWLDWDKKGTEAFELLQVAPAPAQPPRLPQPVPAPC